MFALPEKGRITSVALPVVYTHSRYAKSDLVFLTLRSGIIIPCIYNGKAVDYLIHIFIMVAAVNYRIHVFILVATLGYPIRIDTIDS